MKAIITALAISLCAAGVAGARAHSRAVGADSPSVAQLSAIAKDVCLSPQQFGFSKDASGEIGANVDLPLLKSKLVSLGVNVGGKMNESSWAGVLQKDLSENLIDARKCTRVEFNRLMDEYYPRRFGGNATLSPAESRQMVDQIKLALALTSDFATISDLHVSGGHWDNNDQYTMAVSYDVEFKQSRSEVYDSLMAQGDKFDESDDLDITRPDGSPNIPVLRLLYKNQEFREYGAFEQGQHKKIMHYFTFIRSPSGWQITG